MVNKNAINIDKILYILRHNWFYIPAVLVVALLLAMITIQKVGEKYKVEASLQIQNQSLSTAGTQQELFLKGAELFASETNVADEIGAITSLSTIAETLRDMNYHITLYEASSRIFGIGAGDKEILNPFFQIRLTEGFPQATDVPVQITFLENDTYRVQATIEKGTHLFRSTAIDASYETSPDKVIIDKTLKLTEPYTDNYLNFSIALQENVPTSADTEYVFVINEMRSLAETYRNNLAIAPIFDGASILNISSSSPLPQKEIDFINGLMTTYIAKSLSKKNRLAQSTIASIDKQLDIAVDTLSTIEGSLEDFRSKNEIIDIEKTSENLNNQFTTLNEKKSDLTVKIEYYQYLTNTLTKKGSIDEMESVSTAGIEDQVLSNLVIELNALIQERSSIAFSSSSESPVLKGIDQRIRASRSAVLNNVNSLLSSYTINLRNTEERLDKINDQIAQLPRGERNLTSIERNFSLNDDLYSYLLQKRAEANIALATNVSDKIVIDEAHLVGKAFPSKPLLLIVFILLGLLTSLGVLFWKYITLSKIITESDIPTYIKWPVLDSIPYQKDKIKVSKSLKVYNKLKEKAKDGTKVISIVASNPSEDTYALTKGLVGQMIAMGDRVALVHLTSDLEDTFEQPKRIATKKVINNQVQDLIDTELSTELSVHKVSAGEFAHGNSIQELLFKLRESHDFVLLLAPSLNDSLAYYKVREHLDFTLFIVQSGFTKTSVLSENYGNMSLDSNIGIVIMNKA
ncbi:GumC family protein [Kriegella aquimaris]|uniref:Chain length determinant protein n=1 Tax=Kriegella aquimaris TaxID=192904 RepID=A0A1G9U7I3_9FLAO|nr:GNVR domain-containing protein [Kriegella aquimaris]SDM55891.1 Chain length determinant protein [Kriegella aquimaris]